MRVDRRGMPGIVIIPPRIFLHLEGRYPSASLPSYLRNFSCRTKIYRQDFTSIFNKGKKNILKNCLFPLKWKKTFFVQACRAGTYTAGRVTPRYRSEVELQRESTEHRASQLSAHYTRHQRAWQSQGFRRETKS